MLASLSVNSTNSSAGFKVHPYPPWQKVPSELWSQIFVHCIPPPPPDHVISTDFEETPRDPRLSPITIASICQSWRDIACSTAELWELCWVNLRHPELNSIWLGRTGTRMLYLYASRYGYLEEGFDWGPVFFSILPFQNRWKLLELEMTNWGVPETRMSFDFDCPALETFKLSRYGGIPAWMEGLLFNAPQLRHLQLDTLWSSQPFSVIHLHLPFLSALDLSATWTAAQEALKLLSIFPRLRHLTVLLFQEDDTLLDLPRVKHTHLVSLRLDGSFDSSIILDNVIIPSLDVLHLKHCFNSRSFIDFVHRSRCHISELNIGRSDLSDEELIAALRDGSVHPWIEKLELPKLEICLTPDLFRFLRYSQDTKYLPHLTHLSFFSCEFANVPEGLIADLIISRCRSLLCQCLDCLARPQAREVRLRYAWIDRLGRALHSFDIARLIPLPGDRWMDEKGAVTVLGLLLMEWTPYSDGPGEFQSLYPIKFRLGRPSCSSWYRSLDHIP